MSVESALQTAIYARLSDALSVSVYSEGSVPDGLMARYVVIGADTLLPWSTDGRVGFEATITIHTWDTTADNRSLLSTKSIMGQIHNALNRASFAITGYNLIGIDYEFGDTLIDPDGLTRHGIQRFRALLRVTS